MALSDINKMKLAKISIYPVKSLGTIDLDYSVVTSRGLRFDRRYMLVDENSMLITQREHPRLAGLAVSVSVDGIVIESTDSGTVEWRHGDELESETREVTVWQSTVDAVFAGNVVNSWVSKYLGQKAFLVFMTEKSIRPINPLFDRGSDIVSFADGYPLLLTNETSLSDLNSRLDFPVPMERFRPNVVVAGAGIFDEDRWKRIRIGEVVFRVTKPCARCTVTTIDQRAGTKTGREPLRTLATLRLASQVFPDRFESLGLNKNDCLFGTYLVPESGGGTISINDRIEVLD